MQRFVLVSWLLLAGSLVPRPVLAAGGTTAPPGPAQPTWSVSTTAGQPGASLAFQVQSSDSTSNGVAFVFSWGDGSSTRDPATGYLTVDPTFKTVMSDQVSHSWAAAGSYSVTVTAVDAAGLSSPASTAVTVTISQPPAQNDCGSGKDAGSGAASAVSLTLPANCGMDALGHALGTGASLNWQAGDGTDVYALTTTQAYRLMTLRVSASPFSAGGSPPVWLVSPNGALIKPATTTECGGPGLACSSTNPPTSFLIPVTLDVTGQWLIVFGDATPFGGTSAFVTGSYSFHVHVGGGGDDCVSGRSPNLVVPAPADGPNNGTTFQLLLNGQVNCTGSLPYADLDNQDSYSFNVQAGEPSAISVVSSEGLPVCSSLQSLVSVPGLRLSPNASCPRDSLYTPAAAGTVFLDVFPLWTATTDTRGYQLRVATGSQHAGDCFSGGDAGNTFATASAMPTAACIGDIGAGDPDDWYTFQAPTAASVTIATSTMPQAGATVQPVLPIEIWAPDGSLRVSRGGGTSFQTDMAGAWRLRVTQSVPSLAQAPYAGAYGVSVFVDPVKLVSISAASPLTSGTQENGGVIIDHAVAANMVVALTSSNPAVASVPATMTVPAGNTQGFFPITAGSVSASTAVTLTATLGGVSTSMTLTVQPGTTTTTTTTTTAADTVTVTRVEYTTSKGSLLVQATDSSTTATLSVLSSSGATIGTLTYTGGNGYQGTFTTPDPGPTVTVRSNQGGSASGSVVYK